MKHTGSSTERRAKEEMLFTVREAAFVADVPIKAVNQAIDRKHIRTLTLQRATDRTNRGLEANEAVFLRISRLLAPELRPRIHRAFQGKRLSELPRKIELKGVVLELEAAIRAVENRMDTLTKLHQRVETNPKIRGGEPVFRGTRIPVYGIARKMELGSPKEELLEDHPSLEEQDLEFATRYSKLYPRRGRPPRGERFIDSIGNKATRDS